MLITFLDSPSPLTLIQQQQRQKYGMRNYDKGGHHHDMGNVNGGDDGYGAFNYDDSTVDGNNKNKLSNRGNKNFWVARATSSTYAFGNLLNCVLA